MNFIPYIKENFPQTKIIMITAYDDKESRMEAYDKGVDDFVSKPLRWDILNAAIEKVLNKSTLVEG